MEAERQRAARHGVAGVMNTNDSRAGSNPVALMRTIHESGVPLLATRLLLGGLFVWMASAKVGHPTDFLKEIRLYHMLPESPGILLNSIAIALPWIEIFAGVALILGVLVRGSAACIATMLLIFTPAILFRALAIWSGEGIPFLQIEFDCGCGSGVVVIWQKLLTNSGLFLLALYPLFSRSRRLCLESWIGRAKCQALLDSVDSSSLEEVDPAQ